MTTELNAGYVYRDAIDDRGAGESVIGFYARRYRHTDRAGWQGHLAAGRIRLNGAVAAGEVRLRRGDRLEYHRPPWREPPVPREVRILHRDPDLLAVAKPAGLPVLPGAMHLEHTLLAVMRARHSASVSPVHRLDRGTSGVVLFATSARARRRLSIAFETGRIFKTYRARVRGADCPDAFEITHPIGVAAPPVKGSPYVAHPDGKASCTRGRVLARDRVRDQALVEIDLATGRPHQIRIHLAAFGHALVGEPFYGEGGWPVTGVSRVATGSHRAERREPRPGDGGFRLHALAIELDHPRTGARLRIQAPPPRDLSPESWPVTG